MKLTRREIIKLGLVGSSSLILPLGYQRQALAQESCPPTPALGMWQKFQDSLPIPPLLKPVCSRQNGIDGMPTDYYEIEIKKCQQVIRGRAVDIWGYNGITPGPLIRRKVGDIGREPKVWYSVVRFINQVDENTVVHLHGMASRPEYDGYAEDFIQPGFYKDYIYPNDRAATIWYHDHALHKTLDNVEKGLLGMYIVEDQFEREKLPLLTDTEFDVPIILQQIKGVTGTLVNGVLQPRMEVKRHKYRFRVLNTAPQTLFKIDIVEVDNNDNKFTMKVIGTDSGLREKPVSVQELEIGIAERYEFVIDFNEIFQSGVGQVYLKVDQRPTLELLRFDINPDEVQDNSVVPDTLRPVKRFANCPKVSSAALPEQCPTEITLTFDNNGFCENGTPGDTSDDTDKWLIDNKGWPTKVACAPASNPDDPTCIEWTLRNDSEEIHPVHIHLSDLQIIKRTDSSGQPRLNDYEKDAWKDVFIIKPGESVTVSGVFGPHQGIYMMHCHNLKHEDCNMMVIFQVGDDDTDPSTIAPAKPIAQMEPLCPPQGVVPPVQPQPPAYDSDAIIRFNREVYGPDR